MKNTWIFAALGLAGLLGACGSKKTADETTATTTPVAATTTAPATAEPTTTAPAAAATTAAPAAFDINSVPISTANLGAFPYFSKLAGYKIGYASDSIPFDFDRTYLYDGKHIIAVEGRVLRRLYRASDDHKKASDLMVSRNYENLVKSLGGVQVMAMGRVPSDTINKFGDTEYRKHDGGINPENDEDIYVIRQKDKQIWVQVSPQDDRYQLNVTETATMPQQATTIPAAELKKN